MRAINDKLRGAIASQGQLARIEGCWWQYSLTERNEIEPSAISLLRVARDKSGALEMTGRSWREDGALSARYWTEAAKEKRDPAGIFYYWRGERPRDPSAPQLEGTGEIKLESADRAAGYWITRLGTNPEATMRTSGVYVRADAADLATLDGNDQPKRAQLIAQRLEEWKLHASG
jgi:hypothetical protein